MLVVFHFFVSLPQAELKRLQSANEAACQERKLLLQQQQEITRLREKTKVFKQYLRQRSKHSPHITPIQSPLRAQSPMSFDPSKHHTVTGSPSVLNELGSATLADSLLEEVPQDSQMQRHSLGSVSVADL